MFSIDPAKILLVAVVALVVLGPEKLPGTLHALGKMWSDFQRLRSGLESQVRDVVGDLPVASIGGLTAAMTGNVSRVVDGFTSSFTQTAATAPVVAPVAGGPSPGSPGGPAAGLDGPGLRVVTMAGPVGAASSERRGGAAAEAIAALRASQGDLRAHCRPGRLVPPPAELAPGYDDPICN